MSSENFKNTLNKIDGKQMIAFIKKNVRYFSAGALFVALLIVLVFFTGKKPEEEVAAVSSTEIVTEVETEETFNQNENPAVSELIKNYYTAYASGDVASILTMASPVSENEQAYISLYSQYVEEYQNQVYYMKQGLDANSYIVSVYLEVKFAGVDTVAPGLDMFYVRTNEEGNLYIDNLYSQYNMRLNESALDTSVRAFINEYTGKEDFKKLLAEVQEKYDAAIAADENLATMANVTIPEAISTWAATIAQQSTEAAEETQTTEEKGTEEQTEAEEPATEGTDTNEDSQNIEEDASEEAEEPEVAEETVKTLDKVNIREKADQDSDRLGQAEKGQTFTRIGTEGEWSIVDYDDKNGYIKSEFLTVADASDGEEAEEQEAEEETTSSNGFAEGTEIRLKNTTNIRTSMDETSDKVGVAYPGETVTVVMSYAEGWTKVKWNGETGYVKTDLLQE